MERRTTTVEGEAYADGLPLVEVFGDGARARLVAVFATKRDREFTVAELARQSGLARKSVYEHVDDLVELGVAEAVDRGSATRYRTADSEVAQKCYELNGVALQRLLDVESEDR